VFLCHQEAVFCYRLQPLGEIDLMHVAAEMGLLLFTMRLMQETAIILRNGLSRLEVIGLIRGSTTI
jgi:hypothetical protein